MKRALLLSLAVLTVASAGCATLGGGGELEPEERFERALLALEAERYRAAFGDLVRLYTHYPGEEIGRRALRVLIASELDPRNPVRRLDEGARLAAGYLRMGRTPAWSEPIVETLYLLALELGAAPERVAAGEPLPRLPGPPVTERIRALERKNEQLARRAARVEQLERRIRELERMLAARERELERIRRTLNP